MHPRRVRSGAGWRPWMFGGALLVGGFAPAEAQVLAHEHDYGHDAPYVTFVSIAASGTGTIDVTEWAGSPMGVPDLARAQGNFAGAVTAGPRGGSFTHYQSAGGSFASSEVICNMSFWPLEDRAARVRWDGQADSDTDAVLYDRTAGVVVFGYAGSTSGDRVVSLAAGHQYVFVFQSHSKHNYTADAWGEFTVIEGCNDADFNADGVLNFDDLDVFVEAYLEGCP